MQRSLIVETPNKIGEKVKLSGWVHVHRDHSKVVFIDLRDRSGIVQLVITQENKEAFEAASKCRSEFIVEVEGVVKERPQKASNEKLETGGVEIEVEKLAITSEVKEELPFDVSKEELDLNLQTLLENRNASLRNEKIKAIFKVFSTVLDGYRKAVKEADFQEVKTPKVLSSVTEGGANFFKVKYFNQEAFLAQSPQFYKQMGVGYFERVFEVGPVFRAEPHFTTRHVNEYISLDGEMGFIDSYEDLMVQLEDVFWKIINKVRENNQKEIDLYGIDLPEQKEIPRIRLSEALKIIEKKYGKKTEEFDIDPEGEKLVCEYVKEKYGSDLVFLTHYPKSVRPVYAMPCKDEPELTCTFDLIFRGVEVSTGGQRIHDYDQLLESIKDRGMDPNNFTPYLEIFKFGMPPHGGWGMGSERIVQKLLGLKSIKEAVLYPRDVKRLTP